MRWKRCPLPIRVARRPVPHLAQESGVVQVDLAVPVQVDPVKRSGPVELRHEARSVQQCDLPVRDDVTGKVSEEQRERASDSDRAGNGHADLRPLGKRDCPTELHSMDSTAHMDQTGHRGVGGSPTECHG